MKEEYRDFTINIEQDDLTESPREWDNVSKMVYKHRNYVLGDEKIPELCLDDKGNEHYLDSDKEIRTWLKEEKQAVLILPLYLYEHSGITMKTTPFSDSWDSEQVGYIYATKKDILANFQVKRLTKNILQKATELLEGEVKTYDQYISGDVYYYKIDDKPEIEYTGDSCGNFYGYEETVQAAKDAIDYALDHRPKARNKSILSRLSL